MVYDDHQGSVPLQIKCIANKGLRKIIVHIRYGRQSRTHIEVTFEPDRDGHVIGYVDKGTGVRKTRTGLTVSELKRPVLSRMLLSVRSFLPELAQKLVLNPEIMGELVKFESSLGRKATAAAEPREEREVGVGDMYHTLVDQAAKARGKDHVGTFKVGPHTFKITIVDGKSFRQETVFIQCWSADVPGDSTKPMGSYGIIFTASPSRRGADVRVVRYNGHNRIDAEYTFLFMFKHNFTDTLKELVRKLHEEDHHLEARGIYLFRTPEQAAHAAAEPETDPQETNDAVMHRIVAAIEYDVGQRLNFGERYNGRLMRVSLHRLGLNINRLVEILVSVDVTGENNRDTDWYLSIQQANPGAPWTYWIRDRGTRFQEHRKVAQGDAGVLVKALRATQDVHGHELLQLVAKFCAHVVTTAYERDNAKHHQAQAAAEPEHGTFLYNEARRIKSGRQSSKLAEIGGVSFNVMFLHGALHESEVRLVFEADLNFDDDYESEEEIKFEVFVSPDPCTTNETLKCYAVRRRGLRGAERRTVDMDVTVKQVETWSAAKLVAFVTKYLNAHADQLRKALILPEAGPETAQAAAEPGNEARVWMRFTKAFENDMELRLHDGDKVYNVDAFTPFTSDDHPERRSVSIVVTMPAVSHGRLQPAVEGEFKFNDGKVTFREYNKKEKLIPIVLPSAGPKATLVHMLRQAGALPQTIKATAAAEPERKLSGALEILKELLKFAQHHKQATRVTVHGRDLSVFVEADETEDAVRIFIQDGHRKSRYAEEELIHAVILRWDDGLREQSGAALRADVYAGTEATGPDMTSVHVRGDVKHVLGQLVDYVIRNKIQLTKNVAEAAVEPNSAPDMCEFMGFTVRNEVRLRFMRGFGVTIEGTPVHVQADSSGRIAITFRDPFKLMYLTYRNRADAEPPKFFLAYGSRTVAEASAKAIPDLKNLFAFFVPKAVASYKRSTQAKKAQAAAEPHAPAKDHAFQDLLRKTPETELVTLHGLTRAKVIHAGNFHIRVAHSLDPVPWIYVVLRKRDSDPQQEAQPHNDHPWQEARLYNEHDGAVMIRMTIRSGRRVVEHSYKLTGCDNGTELLQETIKRLRAELPEDTHVEAAAERPAHPFDELRKLVLSAPQNVTGKHDLIARARGVICSVTASSDPNMSKDHVGIICHWEDNAKKFLSMHLGRSGDLFVIHSDGMKAPAATKLNLRQLKAPKVIIAAIIAFAEHAAAPKAEAAAEPQNTPAARIFQALRVAERKAGDGPIASKTINGVKYSFTGGGEDDYGDPFIRGYVAIPAAPKHTKFFGTDMHDLAQISIHLRRSIRTGGDELRIEIDRIEDYTEKAPDIHDLVLTDPQDVKEVLVKIIEIVAARIKPLEYTDED